MWSDRVVLLKPELRWAAKGEPFSIEDLHIPEGKSVLVVYRPKAFAGYAVVYPILLDRKPLTKPQSGGFVVAVVDPGVHTMGYPSRINYASMDWKTLPVETEADEKVYLEVTLQGGWWNDAKPDLHLVAEEIALAQLTKMKRSISP